MWKNKVCMWFALVCVSVGLQAQVSTQFEAKVSRKSLGENERLRVEFQMNKEGDHFTPPKFEGFQVVMGPSQSISNSWVNGVRSFSKTYSYVLQPTRRGVLKIGSATVEIEGQAYKTQPISVEITAPVKNPQQSAAAPQQRRSPFSGFPFDFDPFGDDEPQGQGTARELSADDVFLRGEISQLQPYFNEAVQVEYKLYLAADLGLNIVRVNAPKFVDFWNEELEMKRYEVSECQYNGKPYRCIVVKRVVLYPQKEGEVKLEPLSIEAEVQVPTGRTDFFGRQTVQIVNKTLSSGRQQLKVKPLPEEGKPEHFSGAVGNFKLETALNKSQLQADEVATLTLTVSGEGNFKLFELPKLQFPSALEVYDPEVKDRVSVAQSGLFGNLTASYTIVPQYKGKYPIPSVAFTYFNPKTGQYVTEHSQSFVVDVLSGKPQEEASEAQTPQAQVQTQFHFLKTQPNLEAVDREEFFGSLHFYLWWLLPLLAIPLALLGNAYYTRRQADFAGATLRRNNRLARKYLSSAKKNIGNKELFYESLEKGLHNYLKARLHIATSQMNKEKIQNLLQEKGVEASAVQSFMELLAGCEMARYAPYTETDMHNDYAKATQVITQMDRIK